MNLGMQVLRAARRQGFPVIGATLRDPAERQTWALQYAPSATAEQRADAETWKATFDPVAAQDDEDRDAFDEQRWLKAIAIWTAKKLNIPLATARTEIVTIYRSL